MEISLFPRWWDSCFRLIDEDPIIGNNLDYLLNGWLDQKDSRIQGVKGSSDPPKNRRINYPQNRRTRVLKNYKELRVWQKSYQLCLEIYKATKEFPDEEKYGLKSQLRRAAVSVPSNISEGYSRKTTPEYIQFLYIAYGSICEIETQTLLSSDFGYVETEKFEMLKEKIREVERMLKALIQSLERKHSTP